MRKYFNYNITFKFILIIFLYNNIVNAQQVRVIDNKGTRQTVNNNSVFTSATDPNPSATNIIALENDIWYDTSTTPSTFRVWDGSQWLNMSATSSGWLINGNTGTDPNLNFLGTIDDVRMQIRSFDIPILEFGRRGTLNLTDPARTDYDDPLQSLVYVNGENGVSALQFRADGANFYNPVFFTTPNGSFRLKGSSGITDFFELGSAGPNNDGRLEFIIGDDGTEPIVFKRFDYRNGEFYREFFRVQGSNNSTSAKTRFGININQNDYPVSSNITANSNGGTPAKVMANSTFQVEGSVSKSIRQINSNFTLTEDEHTVIVTANATVSFPPANSCEGRVYVIKNISGGIINSSNYRNQANINTSTINNNSIIRIQSNGTEWVLINNTGSATTTDWSITGNSGTNPTTNYIGTSDAQGLSIRTNNTEAIRVNQTNQNVGIGNFTSGSIDAQLHVKSNGTNVPFKIEATNTPTGNSTGQMYVDNTNGILYIYDGIRNKWLSVDRSNFIFGRNNGNANNTYLKQINGTDSNLTGWRVMRNATITGISAQTQSNLNWTLRVRENSSLPTNTFSLSINGSGTHNNLVNVNLDEGDVISVFCESSNTITKPEVILEIAWRK